jgi:hypothetical protein
MPIDTLDLREKTCEVLPDGLSSPAYGFETGIDILSGSGISAVLSYSAACSPGHVTYPILLLVVGRS